MLTPPTGGGAEWTETVLYRFSEKNDGFPSSGVIFDSSGALYGTTSWLGQCGTNGEEAKKEGCGTVFKLTPPAEKNKPWVLTTIQSSNGGNDGGQSVASLIFDASGALYGTTTQGGASDRGTVFKLTPPAIGRAQWTETVLHDFQ
jgi:uncharacterized repeat protein (TIGR03803 family)